MALGNRIAKIISHHCVYSYVEKFPSDFNAYKEQVLDEERHTSSSVVNIYVGEEFWKQVANLTNYSTWTKHRSCSLRIFFSAIVQCANRCNIISRFIRALRTFCPLSLYARKGEKIEMKAWRELTSLQSSFEGIQGEKIVLFWRFDICGANLIAFIQPCSAREAA